MSESHEVTGLVQEIFSICKGQKVSTIREALLIVQEKIAIEAVIPEEAHFLKGQQEFFEHPE